MNFTLRPWAAQDLESVSKHAIDPEILKFMSDAFPGTTEKWKTWLDFISKDKSRFYFAIEINGEAVGGIGVTPQKDILRKNAELGYWLGKAFWRQGIMTQAIKEVVKLVFEKSEITRIFATPFGNNYASHRALEKAGFSLEARLEKIVIKNEEMLDELIYSIRRG